MAYHSIPRVFRLAVIECDELMDVVRIPYGDYGVLYHNMLQKGVDLLYPGSKVEVQTTKFNVVGNTNYPDPKQFDGIIVSGSKYDAFADLPWMDSLADYIRHLLTQQSVRLYGSCFGHQIIARAAGVSTARSPKSWEMAVTRWDLTKEGMAIFGQPSVAIHQFHQDEVVDVPDGFFLLGSNSYCHVQGLLCPNRVLSLQAHPEFNGDMVAKILGARFEQGRFGKSTYEDAMARTTVSWDEDVVVRGIAQFLTETWRNRGESDEALRSNL